MKKRLLRIVTAALLLAAGFFFSRIHTLLSQGLLIAAYVLVGYDVIWTAVRNIARGRLFDENFLMSIATIGAFFVGEWHEAVAVMLFYQVGELFQSYAVDKSRRSITDLMDIRPDYANVERDGSLVKTDPYELSVGDLIVVKPGEKIPLDGEVVSGSSMLDTSALTGESVPRSVGPGSEVLSGCINMNGVLTVRVTKEFGESTASRILDLMENVGSKKSRPEAFITRFAAVYTPIVVFAALLLAVLPPLILHQPFSDWVYRSLSFLVVSCPCALVISIPLSFFGGIGGASRDGILVKGSNCLESLSKAEIVVFDKTGTLTQGVFEVEEIHADGIEPSELLKFAAAAESFSDHPISQSLKRAYSGDLSELNVSDAKEESGHGVSAVVEGKNILVGNIKLLEKYGIPCPDISAHGTVVYVAINGRCAGYITIADRIKPDAHETVLALRRHGVREAVMLTGDTDSVGQSVADKIGLDRAYTELLPEGKVEKLEELLSEKSEAGKLVFVGDGINDAPVLARSDVGVAMGGLGSDAAIEAADIVIMTDEPSKLADAISISKKTMRIARQNIVFAIGVKAVVLILAALRLVGMWAAVFADVGVAVIAILNALRCLNTGRSSHSKPVKHI